MALSGIQRTFADILASIWGKDAQTSIPTQPVSGIAYRDTDAEFESGQKYDSLGESSRWNQMLYLLTGLMSELTAFGILPWSAAQPYSKGALCIGFNGVLWQAQIDIVPNPTNPVVPGTDNSVWASPEIPGTVPDSRRVVAGTGLTGGGPLSADVTLAAKLTNSVNTTDSTTAASATAVKTAYDRGTEALNEARQKVSKRLDDATGTLPLANGGTGRTDGQCSAAQALLLNGTFEGVQAKIFWSAQDAVTFLLGSNAEGTGLYPILPNKVIVGEATTSSICKGVFTFTGNHPQYLPSVGTWKGFTCPAQSGDLFFCGVKSGGAVVTNPTTALQYGLYVRTA